MPGTTEANVLSMMGAVGDWRHSGGLQCLVEQSHTLDMMISVTAPEADLPAEIETDKLTFLYISWAGALKESHRLMVIAI